MKRSFSLNWKKMGQKFQGVKCARKRPDEYAGKQHLVLLLVRFWRKPAE